MSLLLPWHDGFWEIYHSKPPVDWLERVSQQGTQYVAPNPVTGALDYVSCPEEYYEYAQELEWVENSKVDPNADPYEGWYPFMEFDQPDPKTEELII